MGVRDDELARQEGWPLGVNNVADETALPEGSLRLATNVDLSDSGKPRRMRGFTCIEPGIDYRGLWRETLPFGLFARGSELCALLADESIVVLESGIAADDVVFAEAAGAAYWTDGRRIGRITADLQSLPVGCEQPAGQPALAVHGAGGLAAGRYMVAITYSDASGQESGSTLAVEIEVQAGQGIMLSAIPQPVHASTATINLFASNAGGDDLYLRQSVPAGTTDWLIGNQPQGRRLETQFLSPIPPGQAIAYGNGMLFVASGDTLWRSEPLRYGLTRRADNYVRFGGRIKGLVSVGEAAAGSGLYVSGGGRTYWLAGADPRQWQRVIAYPQDMVPGTALRVRGSVLRIEGVTTFVAHWLASNGVFCIGLPGGSVDAYSEGRYLADEATRGAALLREVNGIRQIVTAVDQGTANRAKFSDTMVATVHRNGVQIG